MRLITNLEWFDLLLRNDCERVISLPKAMQAGVDLLVNKFDQTVEESLLRMNSADRDDYAEMAEDHSRELSHEYPILMRRALLMVMYSKLEYSVHRLCEAAFYDKKSTVEFPCRVFLGESESYIRNTLGVDDDALNYEWVCVNGVRYMRNNLVHSDGYVKGDSHEGEIRALIDENNDLEVNIDEYDCIVLGENSVERIAQRSQKFIFTLLQRIKALPT